MRNDKAQKPCYNIVGDGFYNLLKGYTWLRSGADPDSYYAYYHSAVGMSYTAAYPERTLAVRPATHKSGWIHCHSARSFAHLIVILNEVKNLFNNYVQSEESFRSFANAQDDKVEKQC